MEQKIDARARGISDPLNRLRYLRWAAAAVQPDVRRGFGRTLQMRLILLRRYSRQFVLAVISLPGIYLCAQGAAAFRGRAMDPVAIAPRQNPADYDSITRVWLADSTEEYEIYSNGLRIENRFAVPYRPRSYLAFRIGRENEVERRSVPAGIVFHSSESPQAAFESGQNRALKLIGESLLRFVRDKRAYHFLIDRFGRVYRVVLEADAANHAGYSVWADDRWAYVNLNESFLGIAFEAETSGSAQAEPINAAQLHAGTILTGMLRSRYAIKAGNCVTHAQVSVNPANMRIGYHTDWAKRFPFSRVGLPDNYVQPLPGIHVFGFEYDSAYLDAAGTPAWAGIARAENQLREEALKRAMSAQVYRELLRKRYREQIAAVRHAGSAGRELQ
jgi:hypothetical protein